MKSFRLDTSEIGSWNGIGWTLYGKTDKQDDGSYIATKWFVFFFLPLIPLSTWRVRPGDSSLGITGSSTSYEMVRTKFNIAQVLRTYLAGWGIAAIIILVIIALSE